MADIAFDPHGGKAAAVEWGEGGGMEEWIGGLGATPSDDPFAQQLTDLRGYRDVLGDVPTLGMRAISSDAARSHAAAMGQAGAMPIGGGSSASLRQTGRETGQTKAEFLANALPAAHLARSEAAQQMGQVGVDAGGFVTDAINQIGTIHDLHFKTKDGVLFDITAVPEADYMAGLTKLQALATSAPTQAVRDVYLTEIRRILGMTGGSFMTGY